MHTIKAHEQKVFAFAMSGDGKHFVTASNDNTVKLWDVATGKEVRKWDLGVPVRNLAYARDGKYAATANGNGTLYLLDLR